MKFKICLYLLFAAMLPAFNLFATHNRSGEIVYEKTGPLTVRAKVITFTKTSSANADRDTLTICWGDGSCEQIVRANGPGNPPQGEVWPNDVKYNIYVGEHTYVAEGIYIISMTDPNRNAGIMNVNPPSSENVPFHLQAMINFLPEAAGSTGSPVLLAPPIDIAFVGQPYIHAANAFSASGDSIAYELIVPMQSPDNPVPNYSFPNQIGFNPDVIFSLDSITGKLVWDAPQLPGEYVVTILIKFYQNGILVGTTLRDMMIWVGANLGPAPALLLDTPEDVVLDVNVGETVTVHLLVNEPTPDQGVLELTSTSGLYEVQSPATFSTNISGSTGTGIFNWVVQPEHVREQPYTVTFKAKNGPDGLADIKLVRFRAKTTVAAPLVPDVGLEYSAYPNPTTDNLTFEWNMPVQKGSVHITDELGRGLRTVILPDAATRLTTDISTFLPGVYFAKIQSEGAVFKTIRFVKK